jgi:hypothetical protein
MKNSHLKLIKPTKPILLLLLLLPLHPIAAVVFKVSMLVPPLITKTDIWQFDIFGNALNVVVYNFTLSLTVSCTII